VYEIHFQVANLMQPHSSTFKGHLGNKQAHWMNPNKEHHA